MTTRDHIDRLIVAAVIIILAALLCGCCGPRRALVCYEIVRVERAPVAAGGNVVTYRRVYGPGPATVEQTVRDAAIYAHPARWAVGYRQWECADRARLMEAIITGE